MIWVHLAITRIEEKGREPVHFIAMFENVADRKEASAESARRSAELRALSSKLLDVQEAERRYLAKELHDQVAQLLTGLKLRLDVCQRLPAAEIARGLSPGAGTCEPTD